MGGLLRMSLKVLRLSLKSDNVWFSVYLLGWEEGSFDDCRGCLSEFVCACTCMVLIVDRQEGE
jgi:hypothetical protein